MAKQRTRTTKTRSTKRSNASTAKQKQTGTKLLKSAKQQIKATSKKTTNINRTRSRSVSNRKSVTAKSSNRSSKGSNAKAPANKSAAGVLKTVPAPKSNTKSTAVVNPRKRKVSQNDSNAPHNAKRQKLGTGNDVTVLPNGMKVKKFTGIAIADTDEDNEATVQNTSRTSGDASKNSNQDFIKAGQSANASDWGEFSFDKHLKSYLSKTKRNIILLVGNPIGDKDKFVRSLIKDYKNSKNIKRSLTVIQSGSDYSVNKLFNAIKTNDNILITSCHPTREERKKVIDYCETKNYNCLCIDIQIHLNLTLGYINSKITPATTQPKRGGNQKVKLTLDQKKVNQADEKRCELFKFTREYEKPSTHEGLSCVIYVRLASIDGDFIVSSVEATG